VPLPLPYLDTTATAGAILAVGTAALAYAALRQSIAAEGLATITARQAAATMRRAYLSELQIGVEKDRALAAPADALRAEAVRRADSFPRIRIVSHPQALTQEWVTVVSGNVYQQRLETETGIQNQGKCRGIESVRLRLGGCSISRAPRPPPRSSSMQ
jgi:hypothetical protein